MDTILNSAALRADFPIFDPPAAGPALIYLDNAATTQRPRQVLETIQTFYARCNANIHRSPHRLGMMATELYEDAHNRIAHFIGARSRREIIMVRNTTEALNLVATALLRRESGPYQLQPGDEILITVMEHHSNLVPWQAICAEAGLTLRIAGVREDGTLDWESLVGLLNARTRLVCCTHISNVLGTVNPVAEIGRLAHQAGALFLVDGAQSVPHRPIHVAELNCDFLAFSGHKMLAPFGSGVLYGREELLNQMAPFLYGGDMIATVTCERSTWNQLPWKFEAGTPDVAASVALGGARDAMTGVTLRGAIDYLESIGMAAVHDYGKQLVAQLMAGLQVLPVRILGPSALAERDSLVSFTVEKGDAFSIAQMLDGDGIAVRAGSHCAYPLATAMGVEISLRASPYFYNTPEEIDFFLNRLEDVLKNRSI